MRISLTAPTERLTTKAIDSHMVIKISGGFYLVSSNSRLMDWHSVIMGRHVEHCTCEDFTYHEEGYRCLHMKAAMQW